MTPDQERAFAQITLALQDCRERLKTLGNRYYRENINRALEVETAHEHSLLLLLERLVSGAPPPPDPSAMTVWDRLKKPGV